MVIPLHRYQAVGRLLKEQYERIKAAEKPRATTGYIREDGTQTVLGDAAHFDTLGINQIWATMDDGLAIVVYAPDFTQTKANVDIRIEQVVPKAPWQIYGSDVVRGTQKLGGMLHSATQPPIRYDQNPDTLVGSVNILPGRVYAPGSGLEINIAQFPYTDSSGAEATWIPDNDPISGNSLTATLPPAVAGVNQKIWKRIWFDNTAGAPALGQTDMSPSIDAELDVTIADADAIVTPAGMTALWDVILTTTSTTLPPFTVTSPISWLDRRKFVTGGGVATGSGSIAVTDGTDTVDPAAMIDFDPTYFDVTNLGGDTAGVTLVAAVFTEIAQDAMDAALVATAPLTKAYNDGANTETLNVDITTLASKASPAITDLIMIADAAAGNANKQALIGNLPMWATKDLFVQTATVTVANSVAETTLAGAGQGTLTLPANFWTVGKALLLEAWGVRSTTGTPTIRFRVKIGATVIVATATVTEPVTTLTNRLWHARVMITCRTTGATGTAVAEGFVTLSTADGDSVDLEMVNTTTFTLDTTASALLDLLLTWGTASASNTLSCLALAARSIDTTQNVGSPKRSLMFSVEGVVTTGARPARAQNDFGYTLTTLGVYLNVGTAPTGAAIIVDILKNGVTIFTNSAHRPQIAAAAFSGNSVLIDVPSFAATDYMTMTVVQVGSTIAGSDLTVQMIVQ